MRKIIILLGNSHFGEKIASSLNELNKNIYIYLDTSNKIIDKILYVFIILFASTVYSISGAVKPGIALKIAYFLRKKIRLHFVGSDVTQAINDFNVGTCDHDFIKYVKYAANAPWLKSELYQINIEAEFIPTYIEKDPYDPNVIKKFAILSYLGENKESFYGIDYIKKLSIKFPWLNIYIIGSNNFNLIDMSYANIHMLGWKSGGELNKLINECAVMLRMTDHDGLAHLTVDALFCKNWVIRKEDLTVFLKASCFEDIVNHVEYLISQKSGFENHAGREWAIKVCSNDVVLKGIEKFIE